MKPGGGLSSLLALTILVVAWAVYLLTLAPTLTWAHDGADGGDLITATWVLGVPHPPGYPTYVLLGRLFLLWPLGDPAYRLNLMSATAAAGTVALVYLIAREAIGATAWRDHALAGAAALALAFSPLFWSQAVIAEVYALNALFVALAAYLLLRWMRGCRWCLPLAALTLGLGLGNHLTLAFVGLIAVIGIGYSRARCHTRLEAAKDSRPTAFWGVALLCFLAGLSVYLYLPWSAAQDPPVNWGDPRTLDRFWWVVSGALYRGYLFTVPLEHVPARLAATAGLYVQQFGPWGAAISLVGLWQLWARQRAWAWASAAGAALYTIYAIGYNTLSSYIYLLPAFLAGAVWLAAGLRALAHRWPRLWPLALLLPALALALNWAGADLRADHEAHDYAQTVLTAVEPRAIVLTGADEHTFALWYARYVTGQRPDVVVVDRDLLIYDWYRAGLARRYPDLNVRDAKDEAMLIAAHIAQRPMYLTDRPGPAGYALWSDGPLWRVTPITKEEP